MRSLILGFLVLFACRGLCHAQGFHVETNGIESGFQVAIHVGGHVPSGALADRFGPSNTVGLTAYRVSAKRWRWGLHYRFQTGAEVREPGLLENLRDSNGNIVDNEGRIALVTTQQRGTIFAITAGHIWPADFLPKGSGFLMELGGGFWEHKIHFQNRGNRLTQLDEPHVKGYDRLTGGLLLLPRVGYVHDAINGLVHFEVGAECLLGRLNPNRVWNTDTMQADNGPRSDRAFGLFASWILRLRARTTAVDYYH